MAKVKTKYQKWHDQIISRAKNRQLHEYFERHHIKPKCIGGGNEESNKVDLTYREHFLVHWLLTKFTKGKVKAKMIHCLSMMTCRVRGRGQVITSWQYALARKASIDAAIGQIFSAKRRKNISDSLKGKKLSPKTRKLMSKSKIGNNNALGMIHKEETKRQISQTLKNRYKDQPGPNSGKKLSKKAVKNIVAGLKFSYEFGGLKEKRKEQAANRFRGTDGRWT